jgi:2-amino-4-hydroxy-6-hydroxymethyldihydropteridine diphosphokinase
MVSPVYETEAHTRGEETQPAFLNAVLGLTGPVTPEGLLQHAQTLEGDRGRERGGRRWAPRPLDIDVLAVGQQTRVLDTLTVPHPRLAERRFVLRPWADIAPNFAVPPPFDASVQTLLARCPDASRVERAADGAALRAGGSH